VHLTVTGLAVGDSIVGSHIEVHDTSDNFTSLQPFSLFALLDGSTGGSADYSARRTREAASQVMTRSRMYVVLVADSELPPSAATLTSIAVRISNGETRLVGDYDLNGSVNGGDFLLWQRTLGSPEELVADGSLNSTVDIADYAIWRNNYGAGIGPPGDFDGDGNVNGSDFLKWQRALGSTEPAVDASKNGVVDGADLVAWRGNFGIAGGSRAEAASVPEPSASVLALAGIAIIARAFVQACR
jgi:hypothetical protein